MANTSNRIEWRQQIISELLKHNVIYGKLSLDEIVDNAKKIEEFIFSDELQKSDVKNDEVEK